MDVWGSELGGLVLARYLAQDQAANEALLARIAESAPEAVILAVRRSELVLRPLSPRRAELERAASRAPAIAEQCRILALFDLAHRERIAELEAGKARLASLGAFELLIHASLYAFEHLVPRNFKLPRLPDAPDPKVGVPVGRPLVRVPMVPRDHPVVVPLSKSPLPTFGVVLWEVVTAER